MQFGKSQAALEFLMSYGWAILVALLAISVLAYFGVLNPDRFLPEKCSLPAGLACLDYRVENYKVTISLKNSLGDQITVNNISISTKNQNCYDDNPVPLNNDESAIFTIAQCNNGETGSKFNGMINMTYTLENKLTHTISGSLRSIILGGTSISSQGSCQNAQDNDLCEGLDIVYGLGYRQACCNEYGLCC